jgi:hypothetical protein
MTLPRMPRRSPIPNPLAERDSELVQRLARFRTRVTDMLLDKLAGQMLNDPSFGIRQCPHTLAEVKATALALRVLTKDCWGQDDLAVFDACWQQASCSDLFADEFEAERQRILHCFQTARAHLQVTDNAFCLS